MTSRYQGGWMSVAYLPDGKQVASAPWDTREAAENDVYQQALMRLAPMPKFDPTKTYEQQIAQRRADGLLEHCGHCEDDEPLENPECPACGGPGVPLGSLGRRMHFRCRNCGYDFSEEPPAETTTTPPPKAAFYPGSGGSAGVGGVTTESELEEDWRKWAAGAALGATLIGGGLAARHHQAPAGKPQTSYVDPDAEREAKAEQRLQNKASQLKQAGKTSGTFTRGKLDAGTLGGSENAPERKVSRTDF